MAKKRFIIIDGNSVAHRAFHALPALTNKKGEQIGAVYGFVLALFKAVEDFRPVCVAACFDTKEPTFRHQEFKDYKAQRPPTAPQLIPQLKKIQELLSDLGVAVYAQAGYEADDLIATVVSKAGKDEAIEFIVLTGDHDSLQLVNETTKVFIITRGVKNAVMYDKTKVQEVFGVRPDQIPDFKALAGDSSDNIPGAPGIGKKGAVEILRHYENLADLYAVLEKKPEKFFLDNNSSEGKIKKILADNKEKILCFLGLATMRSDAPISVGLENCAFDNFRGDKPHAALLDAGLPSLAKRLPLLAASRNGTLF